MSDQDWMDRYQEIFITKIIPAVQKSKGFGISPDEFEAMEELVVAAEARGEERAYERQVREHPLFSIGYTKGEIDFGVNRKVADLSLEQMNGFRQMVVVGIGQAESMWRRGMEDRGLHEKGSSPTQGSSNQ